MLSDYLIQRWSHDGTNSVRGFDSGLDLLNVSGSYIFIIFFIDFYPLATVLCDIK